MEVTRLISATLIGGTVHLAYAQSEDRVLVIVLPMAAAQQTLAELQKLVDSPRA